MESTFTLPPIPVSSPSSKPPSSWFERRESDDTRRSPGGLELDLGPPPPGPNSRRPSRGADEANASSTRRPSAFKFGWGSTDSQDKQANGGSATPQGAVTGPGPGSNGGGSPSEPKRKGSRHSPSPSTSSFFSRSTSQKELAATPTASPIPRSSSSRSGLLSLSTSSSPSSKSFAVPVVSDPASLHRSRTLARQMLGPSVSARSVGHQGSGEPSPANRQRATSASLGDHLPTPTSPASSPSQLAHGLGLLNASPASSRPGLAHSSSSQRDRIDVPSPGTPASIDGRADRFSSFQAQGQGQGRRVWIDDRLFEFDSTGNRLDLVQAPPAASSSRQSLSIDTYSASVYDSYLDAALPSPFYDSVDGGHSAPTSIQSHGRLSDDHPPPSRLSHVIPEVSETGTLAESIQPFKPSLDDIPSDSHSSRDIPSSPIHTMESFAVQNPLLGSVSPRKSAASKAQAGSESPSPASRPILPPVDDAPPPTTSIRLVQASTQSATDVETPSPRTAAPPLPPRPDSLPPPTRFAQFQQRATSFEGGRTSDPRLSVDGPSPPPKDPANSLRASEDSAPGKPIDPSAPRDPMEVLSRPMPRELDTGSNLAGKLRRGMTGLSKSAEKMTKKGMTQVQAQVQALLPPPGPGGPLTVPQSTSIAVASPVSPSAPPGATPFVGHAPPLAAAQTPPSHRPLPDPRATTSPHHPSPATQSRAGGSASPYAFYQRRPPSPQREAASPIVHTEASLAARAQLIENDEERKLAEAMFM